MHNVCVSYSTLKCYASLGLEDLVLCSSRSRDRRTSWSRLSQREGSEESTSKRSSAADKSPEKSPEHVRRSGRVDEPKIDTQRIMNLLSTGSDELSSPEEDTVQDVVEAKPGTRSPKHRGLLQDLSDKQKATPTSILDQIMPTKLHENGDLNGSRVEDEKEELGILRRKTPGIDKTVTNKTDNARPKENTVRQKEDTVRPNEDVTWPKADDVRPAKPKVDTSKPEEVCPEEPDDELAELDDKVTSVTDQMEKRRSDHLKRESSHEEKGSSRSGSVSRRSKAISGDQALGIFYYNRRSQVFDGAEMDDLDRKIKEADSKRGSVARQPSTEKSPMPQSPLLSKPLRMGSIFSEKAHHDVVPDVPEEVPETEPEVKQQQQQKLVEPGPTLDPVPTPAPISTPSVPLPVVEPAASAPNTEPESEEVSSLMLQLIQQQQGKRRGVANKAKVMQALLDENEVTIDDHPKVAPAKLAEVMDGEGRVPISRGGRGVCSQGCPSDMC